MDMVDAKIAEQGLPIRMNSFKSLNDFTEMVVHVVS